MPLSLSSAQQRRCAEYLRMHLRATGSESEHIERAAGRMLGRIDPTADVAVVRRVLAREPGAEQELIDRLACLPAMIRVKHRRMGAPLRPHELDDVVQSVLLALWTKIDQYRGGVPLLFWACGFGAVEIRKAIERRGRRKEVPIEPLGAPVTGGDPCPVDGERLQLALQTVGQPDRDIVVAKHFESLTFDDIAARLAIPVNTAKTKYYRALEQLREQLRSTMAAELER